MTSTGVTLVAYDGSEPAKAALACAARRALPGDRLVVAYAAEVPAQFLESPYHDKAIDRASERAATVLEQLEASLPTDIEVESQILSGPPARSLAKLAEELDAGEIAVGSRGFGGFRAAALGSTSHALLHESDRPVLLITRRALARAARRPKPGKADEGLTIVVGYDGSANARAALDYAAKRVEKAGGGRIFAVYAFDAPSEWLGDPYYQRALDDLQQRGREVLGELEHDAPAAGEIHTELIEGPAAEVLVRVAHARDADEMVVGSRGLGRFRAAVGSVSHELLHEADLPLVVVPGSA